MTTTQDHQPTHGWTHLGQAVHLHVIDHHPANTEYQRFNKRAALWITNHVGTMTCFWFFNLIAVASFPAVLNQFSAFKGFFPTWIVEVSLIALIAWISSNWLQLVLLPSLMVGQNLQNEAADARATKTFEDVERIGNDLALALDRLDCSTQGGLRTVLDAISALHQ